MLKKLKLTLLMSSVIFFPKGLYAADQDKDELRTLTLRPASSGQQHTLSLLPVFAQNVDADISAGPSSSQISIGNNSSQADFSPDQFPKGLTIRGRSLYTDVLRSNVGTNIDLKRYFNFSNIEEHNEAFDIVNIIAGFLLDKGNEPLEEVEKKSEELEAQIRAQLEGEPEESIRLVAKLIVLKLSLLDDEEVEKTAIEDILSSFPSMKEDLSLYIELLQQSECGNDFQGKVYDKLDEPEGFTEAALEDILKETPQNSRNLIKRMAEPFLKISNLRKSEKQIPPFPEDKSAPKKISLGEKFLNTKEGLSLYKDLWENDIGTPIDLTKYFNLNVDQGRQEAEKTILIVLKLLNKNLQESLEEVEKKRKELDEELEKSESQKELFSSVDQQMKEMLGEKPSDEDFLSFCSKLLEDPKFQGSNLPLYVDLMQQSKFVGDFFERIEKVKNFTEATLIDILKETPENSKNLIERVGRLFFKAMNLKEAKEKALHPEKTTGSVSAVPSSSSSNSTPVPTPEASFISPPLGRSSYNPAENVGITQENGIITLTTDNRGLHKYQLVSDRIPVKPGERLKISYDITSSEDGIVLDLLNTHRSHWLFGSKVDLKKGPQQGSVEVVIPEGESVPYLVLYNNQTRTPSTQLTIKSLKVEHLPPL